jgi:hypothetical protein
MRFPVYAHNSNPLIDKEICRKSLAYCNALVARGEGDWLPQRAGVHLFDPKTAIDKVTKSLPSDDSLLRSIDTPAAISEIEAGKNAEFDKNSRNNPASVVRAFVKVKMWPHVGDNRAIRVGPGKVWRPGEVTA